jgi:HAD superfamily hydrolase (TIGR01509 family)
VQDGRTLRGYCWMTADRATRDLPSDRRPGPDAPVRAGLIIFDCDGVLVDSEVLSARIEAEELGAAGITISAEEMLARFTGIASRDAYAILEAEQAIGLPAGFGERALERLHAVFERELEAVRGIRAALETIDRPVCVASSSEPARIERSLRIVGLHERFAPHLFSAAMVARGKPAPDLFLHAASRMGVAPAECVVIEDSVPGVRAGVAAGMRVIGFAGASHCGPGHCNRLRGAGADRVLADMAELPRSLDGWPAPSPLDRQPGR